MADVDKISVSASMPADMPIMRKTSDIAQEGALPAGERAPELAVETSPLQERSNNSHQHDSEYDTASDLEGAEDYDDDDDESLSDEEEYDESEGEEEQQEGDEGISLEKADGDAPKKVDEDRSNPQYIPKRGTFYEHDDRESATGEAAPVPNTLKQSPVPPEQAPKPKTRQPITGGDRWSHDRFDPSEQAPKSRSELVSSYGYDIRTEEAPPRARRRRRYARGPSKYQRNWEDENAYMRANNNNKERKPPQSSDFPALNERAPKPRKSVNTRLQQGSPRSEEQDVHRSDRRVNYNNRSSERDYHERDNRTSAGRSGRYGRSNNASGGRQVPMEFKPKQRQNQMDKFATSSGHNNRSPDNSYYERQSRANNSLTSPPTDVPKQQFGNNNNANMGQQQKATNKHSQNFTSSSENNNYGTTNNILHDDIYDNSQQKQQTLQQQQQQQNVVRAQNQQPQQQQQQPPQKPMMPPSNLQQRLQQVQNRNDPSHVGSVQMHALAAQNQMQVNQQQQQKSASNIMMQQQTGPPPNQQQQQPQTQLTTQEQQRGPTKRYSSIRRTQHDAHLSDHQLQQLQIQQQQQQQSNMMMPPEQQQQQHMLAQANLMQQLYHQENLQAQMQALQVSQQAAPAVVKPQAPYGAVSGAPTGPTVPSTAYYVSAPPPAPQDSTPYVGQAPPQPTSFLPQAYGPAAVPPPVGPGAPTFVAPPPSGPPVSGAPTQANATANAQFGNYQNYNTVGGTTYFVPPVQATARPVALPQRRPTNAIPILPPDNSDKNKQQPPSRSASETKEDVGGSMVAAPIGSAENIDHIIDNMFVQRPAFQPPRKSVSPPPTPATASTTPADAEQPTEAKVDEVMHKDDENAKIEHAAVTDDNVKLDDKHLRETTTQPVTEVTAAASGTTDAEPATITEQP